MGEAMDRKEKRALREQEIVEHAIQLFSERGFLGVRMSDIARQTHYSMGTIYSHFESKEDLLIACAHVLVKEHQLLFASVREQGVVAVEQIITLVQGVWVIASQFPELIEIKNLSLMRSIWKRATEQRVARYDHLHEDLSLQIRAMAIEAIAGSFDGYADLQEKALEELADTLTHGLWGLSMGMSSITQSGYAENYCEEYTEEEHTEEELEKFFSINYSNFLKGYGWRCENAEVVMERCSTLSQQLLAETTWFAPQQTGEAP